MILAIDQATTTGWAAGCCGDTPTWGVRDFGGKGRSNGEIIARFRGWLTQTIYDLKPQLVIFESPYTPMFPIKGRKPSGPPINPLTLRRLYAFAGEIEAVCWELSVRCVEEKTDAISKFFTGQRFHGGRDKKKAATILACRQRGWNVEGDDAADALAMWAMAECRLDPRASSRRGDGSLFAGPLFAG